MGACSRLGAQLDSMADLALAAALIFKLWPVAVPGPGFTLWIAVAAAYLMFQGEPFAEEDFCQAIQAVQEAMDRYDPSVIGYRWDDNNPRIQLEPIGARGYIELRAVKR